MIEHRHLLYCKTLAEYAHFGRAADALGIAQPTLTRSLQSLEQELEIKLFDRAHSHVEPTKFGEILLKHGDRILRDHQELIRELQVLQGLDSGEITVSVGLYPAETCVHQAIGCLAARHPRIRYRVQLRDWRAAALDVLEGRADIAVAETSEAKRHDNLATRTIGKHSLFFFCRPGHPLAKRKRISVKDVFSFPWASSRAPERLTNYFPDHFDAAGWVDDRNGDFVCAVQVDTVAAAKRIAIHSDTITPGIPSLFESEVASGQLIQLDFHRPWFRLQYGFIYPRGKTLSPATEAFILEVDSIESKDT